MKQVGLIILAATALLAGPAAGADDWDRGYGGPDGAYGGGYETWYSDEPIDDGRGDFGFYADLDGHGDWIVIDGLGEVWVPYVHSGWRPYTAGYWTWSPYGWFWVAYEPWGYVSHHYGRWYLHPFYGWVWIPGYRWAPAWVVWHGYGDYVAWAPAPYWWRDHPYSHGYHRYHDRDHYTWRGQVDVDVDVDWWVWLSRRDFGDDDISRVVLAPHEAGRRGLLVERSGISGLGPEKSLVEKATGRRFAEIELRESERRIGNETVKVVRPVGQLDKVRRHSPEVSQRLLKPRSSTAPQLQKGAPSGVPGAPPARRPAVNAPAPRKPAEPPRIAPRQDAPRSEKPAPDRRPQLERTEPRRERANPPTSSAPARREEPRLRQPVRPESPADRPAVGAPAKPDKAEPTPPVASGQPEAKPKVKGKAAPQKKDANESESEGEKSEETPRKGEDRPRIQR